MTNECCTKAIRVIEHQANFLVLLSLVDESLGADLGETLKSVSVVALAHQFCVSLHLICKENDLKLLSELLVSKVSLKL